MPGSDSTRTLSEPRTLSQKVWDRHVVRATGGQPDLLFIDLHRPTWSGRWKPSWPSSPTGSDSTSPTELGEGTETAT